MNDDQFFDLAMKVIGGHATEAERADLDGLVARQPKLKAEFERVQADVRLAREVLPLVSATQATAPEIPSYALGRLQRKVHQSLGRLETSALSASNEQRGIMWRWPWLLGLATAAAAVVFMVVLWHAQAPVIQVAMLDTAGASRGSDAKEVVALQRTWNKAAVDSFSSTQDARAWETNWPAGGGRVVVKILYDRPAGELRVLGRRNGKPFGKTFVIEQDFGTALNQAKQYIREQTGR